MRAAASVASQPSAAGAGGAAAGGEVALAQRGIERVDGDVEEARRRILAQPWWLDWTAGLFPVILVVFLLLAALYESWSIPLAVILVVFTDVSSEGAVTLGTTLLWVLVLAILIAGRFAFAVPWRVRQVGASVDGDDPVARVKELLRAHGGGTMSWMTTWPGNSYQFTGAAGRAQCDVQHGLHG